MKRKPKPKGSVDMIFMVPQEDMEAWNLDKDTYVELESDSSSRAKNPKHNDPTEE